MVPRLEGGHTCGLHIEYKKCVILGNSQVSTLNEFKEKYNLNDAANNDQHY